MRRTARRHAVANGLVFLAGCVWLAGCAPIDMALDAGAAATAIAEKQPAEKEVRRTAGDMLIRTRINQSLFSRHVDLFSAITLAVENGRVLMTGSVPTPEDRIEATRLAWQVEGVREVINELQVRDTASLLDRARDIVINKQVQGRLLLDEKIRSLTYSVDTVNGTVYLMGTARSQSELDRAMAHARDIGFVENVISYVTLDPPR